MYKTSQVCVSLELVVEDGAVCGDEDGAAEGQGVVAHAGEEEERGVPEGERHGEEEEGDDSDHHAFSTSTFPRQVVSVGGACSAAILKPFAARSITASVLGNLKSVSNFRGKLQEIQWMTY